jgi:hypothetical protein
MAGVMDCPGCASTDIFVGYTAPLYYKCNACGMRLRDENAPPFPEVLSGEEAKTRRPAMYGLEVCPCCTHAPHKGECPHCADVQLPREVSLVEMPQ